ncbi:TetR/AcrR family transcriptional regulator [Jeotgalibacillus aurantiacus]|uniref:TetR/AcrR family transcriptional regulator n=1 Tax=Jeotgalibacillus aurantiacus TaxID=2763266 RepID=UPI001D0A9432|nr:TetR/AcrR family transcriptional regulator [Jeotgalibacillus aurantiacus]
MNNLYPDKRVVRTRQKMMDALLRTMQDLTFDELTVTRLTKLAGVDRSTFYHHYDSLDHLIEQTLSYELTRFVKAYREPYVNLPSFQLKDLSSSEITLFRSIYERRDFFTNVVYSSLLPVFQQKLSEAIQSMILSDYQLQAIDIDQQLYSIYHSTAITGLITHWIQTNYQKTPAQMASQLLNILRFQPDCTYIVKPLLPPSMLEKARFIPFE